MPLNELYDQLREGHPDLIRASGPVSFLANHLKSIGNLNVLEIKAEDVEPTRDDNGTFLEIKIIKKNISAFDFHNALLTITISSTSENGLTAAINLKSAESWQLDLVHTPWIRFHAAEIDLNISDQEGSNVDGYLKWNMKVGSREISLQTEFPFQGAIRTFKASWPEGQMPVAYLRMFTGGIPLAYQMPETLAQDLFVEQLLFEYDSNNQTLRNLQARIKKTSPSNIALFEINSINMDLYLPDLAEVKGALYTLKGSIANQGIEVIGSSSLEKPLTLQVKPERPLSMISFARLLYQDIDSLGLSHENEEIDELKGEITFNPEIKIDLTISLPFTITQGPLAVESLQMNIKGRVLEGQLQTSLQLLGIARLSRDNNTIETEIMAEYANNTEWNICGKIQSDDLFLLAENLLPVNELKLITDAHFCLKPTTNEWVITAYTDWQLRSLGDRVSARAELKLSYMNNAWNAHICGTGYLHDIELKFCYTNDKKYFIEWKDKQAAIEGNTASIQLGDIKILSLLKEAMVWMTGTHVEVPSPLNLLNDIVLRDAIFNIDFTGKLVSITSDMGGIDSFSKFHLTYHYQDEQPKFILSVISDEFGKLEWDPSDPSTEQVLVPSNDIFELKMLTLGQHLALNGSESFRSVNDAITYLSNLSDDPFHDNGISTNPAAG